MSEGELYWLAGLLEGEGCFAIRGTGHNPVIQLIMTDLDVVIRAAKIMGSHKVIKTKQDSRGGKSLYRTVVYGSVAISLMKKLLPLMGERRSIKINECIYNYECKRDHVKNYKERKSYSRGACIVWMKFNNNG